MTTNRIYEDHPFKLTWNLKPNFTQADNGRSISNRLHGRAVSQSSQSLMVTDDEETFIIKAIYLIAVLGLIPILLILFHHFLPLEMFTLPAGPNE